MSNLQPLKWRDEADRSEAQHDFFYYRVIPDHESYGKFAVRYKDSSSHPATGFATIDDAKEWAWDNYNEKMQPYVVPSPTWIDASKQLPKEDGEYLALIKGFTYEMGNLDDLQPRIGKWNGGRGCFNEDYGNVLFVAWMPIPDFSEVTK